MSDNDDRAAFEAHRRILVEALGRDETAFAAAIETLYAVDQYNYAYLWSWMGVPIIQLPADVMATQEVIWATKPDIIIETGVARGGSVIFMASLLELVGKGKVIGVDVDIRLHNRDTIERHPMAKRIALIEGSSIDVAVLARVRAEIPSGATVMVVLDSDHSRDHVLAELRAYGPLVTPGCYLVVADTVIGHMDTTRLNQNRRRLWAKGDEPLAALESYLAEATDFAPDPEINGKLILSSSPGGYLKRSGAR
jgi:cephalosporin hydroxylase